MTDRVQEIIQELEQEIVSTRRLLETVPSDQLGWRPHTKSMTLGQLANHIALIPGAISGLASENGFDAKKANFAPPQPESTQAILATLEESTAKAKELLRNWDHETATAKWTFKNGEKEIFSIPRIGVIRTILLNHWYHHRGQLTVYLRLLNVPLPVTYGRSADSNPFA